MIDDKSTDTSKAAGAKETRTCVCGNPAPATEACGQCGSTETLAPQTSAEPAVVPVAGPLEVDPIGPANAECSHKELFASEVHGEYHCPGCGEIFELVHQLKETVEQRIRRDLLDWGFSEEAADFAIKGASEHLDAVKSAAAGSAQS